MVFFAFLAAFLRELRGEFLEVSFWESKEVFVSSAVRTPWQSGVKWIPREAVYHPDCTPQIIGAAIKVHRRLGPGLLESAYEACLAYELDKLGLFIQRQKPVPLVYETVKLECGFRADLVVNGEVVVEVKCKEALHPVDQAQLLSYLRLMDLRVGLLINFHVAVLKDGIKRMVNYYENSNDDSDCELHELHRWPRGRSDHADLADCALAQTTKEQNREERKEIT